MPRAWGNGSPIGCTIATPEVADALQGLTFSTFGGNPVTMATTLATIEYMEAHDVPSNCAVQGARMTEKLGEFAAEFPIIGEARGMGLMQALEIVKAGSIEPDAARTAAFVDTCKDMGLLLGKGGLIWKCRTYRAALECGGGGYGFGDGNYWASAGRCVLVAHLLEEHVVTAQSCMAARQQSYSDLNWRLVRTRLIHNVT